ELRFGKFTLNNIAATLAPNLDQPLLGMNVLSQFRIVQDKEEMRISDRK
ncbi:MAG: TIGR02281 family clan AA aspartic protease, partial [Gallionellales bacterium CG_4_9_14_0_8_um_filter_55_61]